MNLNKDTDTQFRNFIVPFVNEDNNSKERKQKRKTNIEFHISSMRKTNYLKPINRQPQKIKFNQESKPHTGYQIEPQKGQLIS